MRPRNDRRPVRKDLTRINDMIRVSKVRVVDADGSQLGVIETADAIARAEQQMLDLVEVAPNADPPVCRIMDYGKYRYEKSKKEKDNRKRQHNVTVKELRLRPKTDVHDLETKLKKAVEFLEQRHKVKFTVIFRGREMAYQDMGRNLLVKVQEKLEELANIEQHPKMEGRRMTMVLAPESEKS